MSGALQRFAILLMLLAVVLEVDGGSRLPFVVALLALAVGVFGLALEIHPAPRKAGERSSADR